MSAPLTARERLERAIAMVPWIASHRDGASIEEVCLRFDLTVDQLQECMDTVFMVGVHPYTPDAMIDVFFAPDRIIIRLPEYFTRPLRLTPAQTFGLLAAGRALQSIPGADASGPLARALEKIATSHGAAGEQVVDIDIDTASTDVLERTTEAVRSHRRLRLGYYSIGRDVVTERVVEPWRIESREGYWRLQGRCLTADAVRQFRLDRVRSIEVLDETFSPPETLEPLEVFRSEGLPRVTLEIGPADVWIVSQYPVDEVIRLDDGRRRVTLAVAAVPWLERLLLRLGPDTIVVEADPSLVGVGAAAARRILDRYLK